MVTTLAVRADADEVGEDVGDATERYAAVAAEQA